MSMHGLISCALQTPDRQGGLHPVAEKAKALQDTRGTAKCVRTLCLLFY